MLGFIGVIIASAATLAMIIGFDLLLAEDLSRHVRHSLAGWLALGGWTAAINIAPFLLVILVRVRQEELQRAGEHTGCNCEPGSCA